MGVWTRRVPSWLTRRSCEDDGQALVEYALLVSLIAIAAVVAVEDFGRQLATLYTSIVSEFP
jgi:Flp pilus assembly pilin Flp